ISFLMSAVMSGKARGAEGAADANQLAGTVKAAKSATTARTDLRRWRRILTGTSAATGIGRCHASAPGSSPTSSSPPAWVASSVSAAHAPREGVRRRARSEPASEASGIMASTAGVHAGAGCSSARSASTVAAEAKHPQRPPTRRPSAASARINARLVGSLGKAMMDIILNFRRRCFAASRR
ncbi:MAG: hypothetical protein IKK82_04220, partial [Kiritimatiellae bacterium]|nr:hypothetical protein [Kiritimatiellia bacterium]